jgi:hypothetical protein
VVVEMRFGVVLDIQVARTEKEGWPEFTDDGE